ncbi:MAG: SPOR domain-containing protein [Balneolaceae bacterium]|nr:SPOR domain-containing protein [Balneolaceae bacterium]
MKYSRLLILFLTLILVSCGTIETATEDEPEVPHFDVDEEIAEAYFDEEDEMDELDMFLYEYRSQLTDQFASLEQDIPEKFLREVVRDEGGADRYAGFRVQIISTRDVALADSTRDDFRAWAADHISGYDVEAYVYFRQPYYRVRAGDFRNRNKAIEFSRLLKDRYPEAWVVHDRIEPDNVPSDTSDIRLTDPSEINLINIGVD